MLGQIIATIYIFDAFCLTFSTIESSCLDKPIACYDIVSDSLV